MPSRLSNGDVSSWPLSRDERRFYIQDAVARVIADLYVEILIYSAVSQLVRMKILVTSDRRIPNEVRAEIAALHNQSKTAIKAIKPREQNTYCSGAASKTLCRFP
jgi:hypothetical protein